MASAPVKYAESALDDPTTNLRWRRQAYKRAETDLKFRRALINRARRDIIFFLKAFAWLEEVRNEKKGGKGRNTSGRFPFIPWPHQVPVILKIRQHLGHDDIVVEKSRDEGVSWIAILMAVHDWLFKKRAKIGMVSSIEDLADDPGNMDSLMAKVDWELEQLPEWLTGPKLLAKRNHKFGYVRNITKHSLLNVRNGATINATAGGPDIFRGGRCLWILMDEMASKEWMKKNRDYDSMAATSKATDSRLMISTPSGPIGAYHDAVHVESNAVKTQIRWSDNPTKNRGLYTMRHGRPVAVDSIGNPLPPEYDPPNNDVLTIFSKLRNRGFNLEKGLRSPWKDLECLRPGETPQTEARELDLNYGGAMDRIFGDTFLAAAMRTEQPTPVVQGHFSVNDTLEKWSFDRQDGGLFWLWCKLDERNNPPEHKYLVACDSATGEGGHMCSNSVLTIIDLFTRQQVGEFASKTIGRGAFADFAIGVCKWFYGAYLAWEHGGPGTSFTRRVLKRNYPDIFLRNDNWQTSSGEKKSKSAGWVATVETKPVALDEFKLAVIEGDLVIRSKPLRMECEQYVQKGDSEQHVAASDRTHGDRVIAMAVAVQAMKDRPAPRISMANTTEIASLDIEPPEDTFAHMLWAHKQSELKKRTGWDNRTQLDMARNAG